MGPKEGGMVLEAASRSRAAKSCAWTSRLAKAFLVLELSP